jgi:ribosomal protein S18 acetylase RimI-like enzyme
MAMNVVITELNLNDSRVIGESLKLLNRTQGQGLFRSEYLTEKASSSEALVLVGFIDDRLVSVGCAEIIKEFDCYKRFDASIGERMNGSKVGSLCTLSVHEDHQGRGLGQKMTSQRMGWLEDHGCDLVLGVSWVSGLIHTSNRVFEKFGFRAVSEVNEFYREDAEMHPFDCPGCKVQPCECSAILYDYDLKSQASHRD